MPIYEYECDICGAHYERRQSFYDNTTPPCPHGHAQAHRIYSTPGVVFKGSGWYVTDSRKSQPSTATS